MKTYTVLYAEDVPHYGTREFDAADDTLAIDRARAITPGAMSNYTNDPDYNNTRCRRIVHIEGPDGIIAEDIYLGADDSLHDSAHHLGQALELADRAPAHTPEPWLEDLGDSGNILVTDEQGVTIATCWKQPLDPPDWVQANARLIANAPKLLKALEDAFVLLDRISDTLHYEDGLPVTALESRDIEIIYGDAITELARFETLIREARGHQ